MARGFGTVKGSGTTDVVVSALSSHPSTVRSYHIWFNFNDVGGASLGRIFDGTNTVLYGNAAASTIQFLRLWTANGQWTIPHDLVTNAGTWHGVGVAYDGGAASNQPVMYLDGASQTVSEINTASGSITTTSNAFNIGNNAADTRNWDGILAEFAVWDATLTAGEFLALGKGFSPLLIRPASLIEHVPMVRDNISRKLAAPSITGTAVQPHPRVIMPFNRLGRRLTTATAGGNFTSRWYYDLGAQSAMRLG